MNSPFLTEMKIPVGTRRSIRLFPGLSAWVKALCLLPLALPGARVVLSGFSWFTWLNFPLSGLVATVMFLIMHLLIPLLILAGIYHVTRSIWSTNVPKSGRQTAWFAVSTLGIILLSFLGTVGVSALAELSICRLPQVTVLIGSCSNHFLNMELSELAANIDTYNFRYYNWLVWMVITAYLYQLETHLLTSRLAHHASKSENLPHEPVDLHSVGLDSNGLGQPYLDETA